MVIKGGGGVGRALRWWGLLLVGGSRKLFQTNNMPIMSPPRKMVIGRGFAVDRQVGEAMRVLKLEGLLVSRSLEEQSKWECLHCGEAGAL